MNIVLMLGLCDAVTLAWLATSPTGDQILPREGHSAAVMGSTLAEMWIFGGVSYGHLPFNDLWMYDASM